MKVLVACEYSQIVTKAFRERGHEAYSCDILPTEGNPEWHFQVDVFDVLHLGWDLIILHPPCTKLCASGNRTYAAGKPKHSERLESGRWTHSLWYNAKNACDKVCMENPVGVLNTLIPELPTPQYIQPYQFGNPDIKKTGLWLHGLPKLIPTNIVEPEYKIYRSSKNKSGISKYGVLTGTNPSTNNPKNALKRSKTFEGIAKAMAEQWG